MMRKVLTLGFVIAAGVVLLAQSWTPVIITGVPGGGARTPEEKAVQEQLEASLADALVGLFPCAVPTTSADLASEHGDARAQQSAGAGEAESLERMRAATGAQDVVSVKVVSMNGQFVVDVAYMDMRTGRTQARSGGPIDGSAASIDRVAGEFAAKLQKVPGFERMKGCAAERDWAGTIGYRFSAQPTSAREKDGCKEDERSKENWNYTVRIPPAGQPSAVVAVTRLLMKESNCVRRGLWCGTAAGPVDQQRHQTETWQWIGAPRVDARVTFDEYRRKAVRLAGFADDPDVADGKRRDEVHDPLRQQPGETDQPGDRRAHPRQGADRPPANRPSRPEKDLRLCHRQGRRHHHVAPDPHEPVTVGLPVT